MSYFMLSCYSIRFYFQLKVTTYLTKKSILIRSNGNNQYLSPSNINISILIINIKIYYTRVCTMNIIGNNSMN